MEQQIKQVRRSTKYSGIQCRPHVDDKLVRQSRINQFYRKIIGYHPFRPQKPAYVAHQPIGYETGLFRCQHDPKETFLEEERHKRTNHRHSQCLEQTVAQSIEMFPKCPGSPFVRIIHLLLSVLPFFHSRPLRPCHSCPAEFPPRSSRL